MYQSVLGFGSTRMNLTRCQSSKNIYMAERPSSLDKTQTGLRQGPWVPRGGPLPSREKRLLGDRGACTEL